MLSVNNITMRFGPRVLFENVTCTFMAGRRYAITGPNGAGKSTCMKILTGEIDSTSGSVTRPKKMGVLRQDQFAFDEYRVIDTVIMGNAALWKALEERHALYAKPHEQLTDADGMRLGELEGIVGEEGGYTAEADGARATGAGAFRESNGAAARRADEQPGPGLGALAAKISLRLRRRADRHLARPALFEQRVYAHRGHRLPDDHHVRRRLRRYGGGQDADSRADRGGKRQSREKNRAVAGIYRAVFRGHAFSAGDFAQEGSRALTNNGAGEEQHPAAVH